MVGDTIGSGHMARSIIENGIMTWGSAVNMVGCIVVSADVAGCIIQNRTCMAGSTVRSGSIHAGRAIENGVVA